MKRKELEKMDDMKIIDLFWQRSETAIEETSKKYSSYLRTIAYNILSNHFDAEECENDTYTATWYAIPPARPMVLKAFLGRITRNIACDRYDYNTAKKRNSNFDVLLSELEDVIASPEGAWCYEEGEVAKLIHQFLLKQTKRNRVIFVYRYWHSESISSIATRFRMSEGSVTTTLSRLRHKLRVYLEKEGVRL